MSNNDVPAAAPEEREELDAVRSALDSEYELLEELGRGGMGIVYRARERALHREVAVKVLPFALTFDPAVVERFEREARTSAQLEHPGIVPIYRVGRSARVTWFVMRYVRGRTLTEELLSHGTLPVPELRRLLAETGAALAYAAKRGVVHRDIKPDNIMVDEDGRYVLADFGIARTATDQKLTATGMSVGTPRYMSPEQARARPADGRSDIYSLGVVAYECLTGQAPFDGGDPMATLLAHLQEPVPRPKLLTVEERELYSVIERMLAKDPARRPQSGEELLAALAAGPRPSTAPVTAGAAGAGLGRAAALEALRRSIERIGPALRAHCARALDGARALREGAAQSRLPGQARESFARGATLAVSRIRSLRTRHLVFAGSVVLALGAMHCVREAAAHRSRCPAAAAPAAAAPAAAASSSTHLSLLVDPVPDHRQGSDLRIFYDVCGLERGTAFLSEATVSPSGIGRILRRTTVRAQSEERAAGPAFRRSHRLDTSALEAGSYTLQVVITDSQSRRRTLSVPLRITPN